MIAWLMLVRVNGKEDSRCELGCMKVEFKGCTFSSSSGLSYLLGRYSATSFNDSLSRVIRSLMLFLSLPQAG